MRSFSISRRRQLGLALAALALVAGGAAGFHDGMTLAALILAVSLIWSSRDWKAWLLATTFVAGGAFWSSIDTGGCSAWWKGKVVLEKAAGRFAYVGWPDIFRQVFSPCFAWDNPDHEVSDRTRLLEEKVIGGQKCQRFQTGLGDFWIPAPGQALLTALLWEMTVQKDYESQGVAVQAGDTVLDCGGHVGVFTRYALRRGAGRVIAIEPDPTNLACLEANLAEEIAAGKVKVVKAGVWKERTHLRLSHSEEDSARDTFMRELPGATSIEGVLVLPLDEIVDELGLDRVDFIKMDIEGSERAALQGARQTLGRFKPRMAICTYHLHDDAIVIPAIAREGFAGYRIHAKDLEAMQTSKGIEFRTKVLFFR